MITLFGFVLFSIFHPNPPHLLVDYGHCSTSSHNPFHLSFDIYLQPPYSTYTYGHHIISSRLNLTYYLHYWSSVDSSSAIRMQQRQSVEVGTYKVQEKLYY
jgi:uncharacterized membrane protein